MVVEIERRDQRTHRGPGDREQRPGQPRRELPRHTLARGARAEPADAEQRVPSELVSDHCGGECKQTGRQAGGYGGRALLTRRERGGQIEQQRAADVVFLERAAAERVHEHQLQVKRDAHDEPVGDAWRAGENWSAGRGGQAGGEWGGGGGERGEEQEGESGLTLPELAQPDRRDCIVCLSISQISRRDFFPFSPHQNCPNQQLSTSISICNMAKGHI